jgi:hypothetical protein
MRQLYPEASCVQVEGIICHINYVDSLGRSMWINITWIQIILGVGTPLLEKEDRVEHCKKNWFLNVQEFLILVRAQIKIRRLWQPTLLRRQDFFIMERVVDFNPSRKEI